MFSRLLSLFGVTTAEEQNPQIPPPVVDSDESHDNAFRRGSKMISPHMRLHGRPERTLDAMAKVDLDGGIALLEAAVAYNPANWAALWTIGKAHQARDHHDRALEAFKRAFELQRKNPDVAREYMFTCLQLGLADEGIVAAKHALELNPSDAGLHANLALAHIICGNLVEALSSVDQSLAINPADPISARVRDTVIGIRDGRIPPPKRLADIS